MPTPKELRFFDQTEKYERGLDYYESLFNGCEGEQEVGEASPPYWNKGAIFNSEGEYVWDPQNDAPTRIHRAYPDLKIIISLRNPVSRMSSQYWKNVRQGRENAPSLVDAVREELDGKRNHRDSEICWIYKNSYSNHLEEWIDNYGEKNIKVLIFEEWIEETEKYIRKTLSFIGAEDDAEIGPLGRKKNSSRTPRFPMLYRLTQKYLGGTRLGEYIKMHNLSEGRPKLSEQKRADLFGLFEEDIRRTEALLDRSLDIWRP
jgi:hypothetical protein